MAEENTKGPGKKSVAVEGQEVKMASENGGIMVSAQVKPPVPTKIQISEKYQDAEEEVFVCLRREVLTRQVDGFVMLSTGEAVEAVGNVAGWEANGQVQVMAMTLRLRVEAVVVVVVVMMAEAEAERLEEVAVGADGKAVMAELKALKEEGRASSGKVVVGILSVEVKEDMGVVPLEGAGGTSHPREAVAADC